MIIVSIYIPNMQTQMTLINDAPVQWRAIQIIKRVITWVIIVLLYSTVLVISIRAV